MTRQNILLWGIGSSFANDKDIFFSQEFAKQYNIMACIAATPPDKDNSVISTIPVITKHDIINFAFDKIVIAALPHNLPSIRDDAASVGVPLSKIITADDLLTAEGAFRSAEYSYCERVQQEVISNILSATEEQIHDYEWLYKQICRYGIYCFNPDWQTLDDSIRWTRYGIMQVPEEFAAFCILLGKLKISTAIEIGVFRGKSSYFMCAVLQRLNPTLTYKMVDIRDNLESYATFARLLPSLEKCIPSTSNDYIGEQYDFVFIDADHSYDASIKDYYNLGQYSKVITAFHDIYAHEYDHLNGGTVRMWNEVSKMETRRAHGVFAKYPNQWMGIGFVI